MANSAEGLSAVVYYAITYALATLGAFAVVNVVEQNTGNDHLDSFAGLKDRSPALALALLIFLLSSAGIPPLAGFFGKFYVFTAGLKNGSADLGLMWLVVLALLMSAVSFYYYLQVLKRALVLEAGESTPGFVVSPTFFAVILLMAVGVIALGCFPTLLLPEVTDSTPTAVAHQ
jgi:NADH-quinone oxidoreductase subunit N